MPSKYVERHVADMPDDTVETADDDVAVGVEVVAIGKIKYSSFNYMYSFKFTCFLCCCSGS